MGNRLCYSSCKRREFLWSQATTYVDFNQLSEGVQEWGLEDLVQNSSEILKGQISGRVIVNVNNMDWDKLKIFHAVTQAGSFTKAGEVLNLSQSAISRQIQSLEYELKCSFFKDMQEDCL